MVGTVLVRRTIKDSIEQAGPMPAWNCGQQPTDGPFAHTPTHAAAAMDARAAPPAAGIRQTVTPAYCTPQHRHQGHQATPWTRSTLEDGTTVTTVPTSYLERKEAQTEELLAQNREEQRLRAVEQQNRAVELQNQAAKDAGNQILTEKLLERIEEGQSQLRLVIQQRDAPTIGRQQPREDAVKQEAPRSSTGQCYAWSRSS